MIRFSNQNDSHKIIYQCMIKFAIYNINIQKINKLIKLKLMETALRIKEIMKKKKISQRMMAVYLGVTPNALSKMLMRGNMNVNKLSQIAEILEVDIKDLFDDSSIHHVQCPFCGRNIPLAISTSIVVK
jgi:DNA-binding Xre family transcriptional regulator